MNQVVHQKAGEGLSGRDDGVIMNDMRSSVSSPTAHQNSISDGGQSRSTPIESSLSSWSDLQLWNCCRSYGEQARRWRNRFAGLLPEVFRRRLFERRGFESIFVFAKKLAGMSEESVRRILNLEKRLESMPHLQELLVKGLVSPHKLRKIVSIATPENQESLSEKVQMFSKAVIETMVKDVKIAERMVHAGEMPVSNLSNLSDDIENSDFSAIDGKQYFSQIGLFEAKNKDKNGPGTKLHLDRDIEQELLELQEKGIDVNAFLRKALLERKRRIEEEKAQISKDVRRKFIEKTNKKAAFEKRPSSNVPENVLERDRNSRRIPAQIVRLLREEYGTQCSIPTCQKASKNHHHLQRFSVAPIHDPYFIAPLCSEHHTLAHGSDVKFAEIRSKYG